MKNLSQLHLYQDEHDVPKELHLKRFDEPRYRVFQRRKIKYHTNPISGYSWSEAVPLKSYVVIGPLGQHGTYRSEEKAYLSAFQAHHHWRQTALEQFTSLNSYWMQTAIETCIKETAKSSQSIKDWCEQNLHEKFPVDEFIHQVKKRSKS